MVELIGKEAYNTAMTLPAASGGEGLVIFASRDDLEDIVSDPEDREILSGGGKIASKF